MLIRTRQRSPRPARPWPTGRSGPAPGPRARDDRPPPVGGRQAESDPGPDEGGGVGGGQFARPEPGPGAVRLGSAGRAGSCASRAGPGRRPTRYQRRPSGTSRCGSTCRLAVCTAGGGVAEPDPLGVAAGQRDRGQDAGSTTARGRRRSHAAGTVIARQRLDPAAQPGRHHLHHLGQRPHRRLRDAVDRALRRAPAARPRARRPPRRRPPAAAAPRPPRAGSRRRRRAGPRPGSPARAAGRRPGAACAADTPSRSASSLAGPVPVGLQQGQQPQGPGARVRHVLHSRSLRSESDRYAL